MPGGVPVLIGALLAWGVVAGGHPLALGVVAVAALKPGWFLAGAAGWAAWYRLTTRSDPTADEGVFLRALASELRAGASLRPAPADASLRTPGLHLSTAVRLASSGRPAADVGKALEAALPLNGRRACAAYRLASTTGGAPAVVFEGLARRAAEAADLARERRTLTAQARLSAWLVGGAPIGFAVVMVVLGRGPGLEGAGGLLMVAGLGLELVGALVVWWMVRRSER